MYQIGPLTFHTYGLILGIAIIVCWSITERIVKNAQVPDHVFSRSIIITIISGILGARIYHVIDYWQYYSQHLVEITYLWQGGLGIWGAVIGGLIGLFLSLRKTPQYWWPILDSIVCALPLGQAIGRWGNYINHELFGKPTNLPWRLYIPAEYRPTGFETVEYYHPLFLYESLLNVCLFFSLWMVRQRGMKIGSGQLTGLYLVGYGIIRFMLEPLRIEPWALGYFTTAQWVSIIMALSGVYLLVRVGWKHEV